MTSISAVVYSLNEADLLESCLPRLADFDEVVVCDMQSTDATRTIARKHSARIIDVPRVPVVEQVRQIGLDQATSDWVLFVDADEILPLGFRNKLEDALQQFPDIVALRLRYENYAFGYPQSHTLSGSAKFALMLRSHVHYADPAVVHVPPEFDGQVADAPDSVPAILHLNFRTVGQAIEKVLRYAQSRPEGQERLDSPLYLVREITRTTVFGGGWRDGRAGVTLAAMNAFGRFYAGALRWEQQGYPDDGWTARQARWLGLAQAAHDRIIRARNAVRRRPPASSGPN